MPVINLAISQLDQDQKTALIEKFTAAAVEVTRIPADKFVVLIDELPADNIGVGGVPLSALMKRH
jgi:4-oxalocrotonate tautomerase